MSDTALVKIRGFLARHSRFLGPGLVVACGFIDPGNWATDLQAGADYGYKLLFIVLLAGLAAITLQLLCVRLGAVTSSSLAAQTRQLFLRWEAKYPRWRRWIRTGLYVLYGLAEIAIVATDLAELLGTAIALNLLFPKLPLYAGVLITASDTLLVLVFFKSDSGRQGMMFFEIVIVSLVLCVFISFMILLHLVQPDWGEVFYGFVPSSTLVKPGALYTGVGIIGATVMPHALFLGTSIATVDRLGLCPVAPTRTTRRSYRLPSLFKRRKAPMTTEAPESAYELDIVGHAGPSRQVEDMSRTHDAGRDTEEAKDADYEMRLKKYEKDIRAFDRIRWADLHLLHYQIDTAMSLVCFALLINASILIVAGAAYFYGPDDQGADANIKGAHELLGHYLGSGAAVIFALALLCAGQSASITATLAGQIVSEGFIEWKTSPVVRRGITRLIGVIPSVIVAVAVGYKGLDAMLVASQVILSIILPTVVLPLVYLCSQKDLMAIQGPEDEPIDQVADQCSTVQIDCATAVEEDGLSDGYSNTSRHGGRHLESPPRSSPSSSLNLPSASGSTRRHNASSNPTMSAENNNNSSNSGADSRLASAQITSSDMPEVPRVDSGRRQKSYASPLWVTILGYFLFAVVVLANSYVIIQLILGNGD